MIDTHTHLYLEEFDSDGREAAVERALNAGVTTLIFPNVDNSTIIPMLSLHEKYPNQTYFAMGLHPTEVNDDWEAVLNNIQQWYAHPGCIAVGEVGIDLYWDKSKRDAQMQAFRRQLQLARKINKPVIIHCREALNEVLECIEKEHMETHPMVFHSFTGSPADAQRIISLCENAKFGINGVVTFKNARELRDSLPTIGLERIMLETDSPYLAPVPYRGRRNESAYIPEVCKKIGDVFEIAPEEVERITDTNAKSFFGIP